MNTTSAARFMSGLMILLVFVTMAYAGGWDIVTLKDSPDFAVVGQPLNLTFAVWVPSLDPLTNLHPKIRATNASGLDTKGSVKADAAVGEYTGVLVLPEPGDWVITI